MGVLRPSIAAEGNGQCIYAYCNVRTNQVLYSFSRFLHNTDLKQLPDSGANNNPPKLRKDLWRPLWSVHLPSTEHGPAQGRSAFKMLRDFRIRHETSWEPPAKMSIPYTEAQIKKLEKHLEQRGGSKKESAYDLIARKKHAWRAGMVMNQRANSIADLAAVLIKQENDEVTGFERQVAQREKELEKEQKEIRKLARLWKENGPERQELEDHLLKMRSYDRESASKKLRLNLKIRTQAAKIAWQRMRYAAQVVEKAKEENSDTVPGFPTHLRLIRTKQGFELPPKIPEEAPTNMQEPITVRWANTLDAEFAEQWPAHVRHEPMGIVRHSAPDVRDEPILDPAVWRASKWKAKTRRDELRRAPPTPKEIERERVLNEVGRNVLDGLGGLKLEEMKGLKGVRFIPLENPQPQVEPEVPNEVTA